MYPRLGTSALDERELSGGNVFMARRARDSVAPLRRRSAGWMPARQ